ncbi:MAG: YlqD family protein [Prochlorothrix sp.]|nr:YlqD family protein [Prochlorothrix sp.]
MDADTNELLLKRAITIKAVVTPRWKEEAQQQLQGQINQLDGQLQQLEMQGQRMISEIQRQSNQPGSPQVVQQVDNVQIQVNQKKSEFLEQKNRILQQLQQVQTLEMEQEVNQGQIDSFCKVKKGDNLVEKMRVEVLLRDGVVEDIRGQL